MRVLAKWANFYLFKQVSYWKENVTIEELQPASQLQVVSHKQKFSVTKMYRTGDQDQVVSFIESHAMEKPSTFPSVLLLYWGRFCSCNAQPKFSPTTLAQFPDVKAVGQLRGV